MASDNMSALKKSYEAKLEVIYEVSYYTLTNQLIKLAEEYASKMDYHVSAMELFNLREKYNSKKTELNKKIAELNKKYQATLKYLKKDKIDINKLDKVLYELSYDSNHKLSDGNYFIELMLWKNDDKAKLTKKYKDNDSKINNIMNIVSKRLNESYKIYQRVQLMKKLEFLKEIDDNYNLLKSVSEQANIIIKYEEYCRKADKHLLGNKKLYETCLNIITRINKEEIDLDLYKFLEDRIVKIVTKEYLPYLNGEIKLDQLDLDYDKNMGMFFREESKYTRRRDKFKLIVLDRIRKNYEDLCIIEGKNKREVKKIETISAKTPLKKLMDIDKSLEKDILLAKKKAIKDSYEYVIYFYAANNILDKMPKDLRNLYAQFAISNSETTINKCYTEMLKANMVCFYNSNYDLETTVRGDYRKVAREVILKNIEEIKKDYARLGEEIPKELILLDKKKEEMDIIALYELYGKLVLYNFDFLDTQEKSVKK